MDHGSRLLIYSHDSFGLGHLRRCRAIAHHLVERYKHLSVLILSGSPIIGSFDFRSRRRFRPRPRRHQAAQRRIHGAQPASRHREDARDPPLDHPPHRRGVRAGRVPGRQGAAGPARRGALDAGDAEGARHALHPGPARRDGRAGKPRRRVAAQDGLPGAGALSTTRSGSMACREIFDPLREIPGMTAVADKVRFTGYLERTVPEHAESMAEHRVPERAVHPGDARRRRRRRRAGRLGDQRLRAAIPACRTRPSC